MNLSGRFVFLKNKFRGRNPQIKWVTSAKSCSMFYRDLNPEFLGKSVGALPHKNNQALTDQIVIDTLTVLLSI